MDQCRTCGVPVQRNGMADPLGVEAYEQTRTYRPDHPMYAVGTPLEFGECPECSTLYSGGAVDRAWLTGPGALRMHRLDRLHALEREHATTTRTRDIAAGRLAEAQRRGDARGDLDSVEWRAAVAQAEDTLAAVEREIAAARAELVDRATTPVQRAEKRPSMVKRATRAVVR